MKFAGFTIRIFTVEIVDTISYVLIAFVAISLVVSSIMIGVITYISVLERRKEIGILRAIGASKGNISQVFNAETCIIGLCAGLIGIGLTLLLLIPGNALIHCVGKAGVAPVFDQGKIGAGAVAAGLFQTFIGGTVVHDDELKILLCLGIDRLDGVLEPAFAVDVGDNDGCFHI